MLRQLTALVLLGPGSLLAFKQSTSHQSNQQSEYSKTSSHQSNHAYSHSSQSSHGPGYSYSYSYHTDHGSPYLTEYAPYYHSYNSPLFISPLLLDLELDSDLDDDLDFYIDTDLDLDLDLDFPGIDYGLGYIGKYGHWYRIPKYGSSKLYRHYGGDLSHYGGNYGYSSLGLSNFGSSLDFYRR
ncbi:uncharacterized protein LOC126846814 [Adelges cooleyi]|uniref:uncharacterized protein LOC126846814 n=1 Tax=Adelges cooleyi TaxID=133065 RepID=UPI00217FBC53|nr:uncharacterized protein LOC126846814 [Adelges cooleyi]